MPLIRWLRIRRRTSALRSRTKAGKRERKSPCTSTTGPSPSSCPATSAAPTGISCIRSSTKVALPAEPPSRSAILFFISFLTLLICQALR